MASIDPTAIVDSRADVAATAEIGPFCVVEAGSVIGGGTRLESHVVVRSGTTIGPDCHIFHGAVLGNRPQHTGPSPEWGDLIIGARNVLREHVTLHAALHAGEATRLGDDNYIMVGAHVAHDCQIGNCVVMANNSLLGGHVEVHDCAFLSGAVAVHQFCRIGTGAMVGGQAHITQDVLPHVTVDGRTSRVVGLNLVGLRRRGVSSEDRRVLKEAYRLIFRSGMATDDIAAAVVAAFPTGPASVYVRFLKSARRGFVRERQVPRDATIRLHQPEREDAPAPTRHVA